MRYIPPTFTVDGDLNTLEGYELADSHVVSIWNEAGDIVGRVVRPDGSVGFAFGGPVYDPPRFLGTLQRCTIDETKCSKSKNCSCSTRTVTAGERSVLDAMAREAGWLA